jgi:hypothetical protein
MKFPDRAGFATAARWVVFGSLFALALLPVRSAHAQASVVGSFQVRPGTHAATQEDRSRAAIFPRGVMDGGMVNWQCVERGGLAVGVSLDWPRDGGRRHVAWRFDGDGPDTASVTGFPDDAFWYLPSEDVAPFTLRARQARQLVIKVWADAGSPPPAEYVYELAQAVQALERLPCARNEPVAGRPLPQNQLGLAPPPAEGTYELAPMIAPATEPDSAAAPLPPPVP